MAAVSKLQALWNTTLLDPKPTSQSHQKKISYPQQVAVACTGIIWTRYSTVITPKNWNLFSVNVAMAGTGLYQLSRKIRQDYFPEKEEAVIEE